MNSVQLTRVCGFCRKSVFKPFEYSVSVYRYFKNVFKSLAIQQKLHTFELNPLDGTGYDSDSDSGLNKDSLHLHSIRSPWITAKLNTFISYQKCAFSLCFLVRRLQMEPVSGSLSSLRSPDVTLPSADTWTRPQPCMLRHDSDIMC